jgi:polyphosphate:AMP phosphotransferase
MFETAELGRSVPKDEYRDRVPALRERILEAQAVLREARFPVIVLFAGVDGAGKGETANLLNEWMDPRGIETRAFDAPTREESERQVFWRYWRDLPPHGRIGIFLSAWYRAPLLDRVYGKIDSENLDDRLDEIVAFERTLVADGALIVKFWMHLDKKRQRDRLKSLERDPLHRWRVTPKDWDHWKRYDDFIGAAERLILRTSTGEAPWTIVEGFDTRFRSLKVGSVLLERIERRLAEAAESAAIRSSMKSQRSEDDPKATAPPRDSMTVLSGLDLSRKLGKKSYAKRLQELHARLNLLHRGARDKAMSTILLFEGWDAAGKGGAIRRITPALDARSYQVISIAAPTDEEQSRHYLWRFWRHLPRAGRVTVFDRSWYGRVLVERVEGLASEKEWRRAYSEINDFELLLINHGIILVKFWIHITKEEQQRRFEARQMVPHKRWKITDEDWRNREKWDEYETAVDGMIERTSTRIAPWHLIEGNDKRYARIKVLETVCDRLEAALADGGSGAQNGTSPKG